MNQAKFRPVVVLLVAATIITGLLLLAPGGLMDGYDLARMHQCYKSDLRSMVLAGEMPWWNPYTALGRPFLADVETATLYPPTWLVIPFGVNSGIVMIIVLHFLLVIEGMRRLAGKLGISREFAWVSAISFALSGALLARIQLGQLQVFCVICLWPWIWWSAVRLQDEPGLKGVARTALFLALSFLAGSPQILWCGLVPLAMMLLVRTRSFSLLIRLLFKLVAAGALATGLIAVQLLPFAELVQQGNRPLHDVGFATYGGIFGINWLTLLIPPGPWLRADWEFNLHGGVLFLIFAGAATRWIFRERDIRSLVAAGLFGIILAMGDKTFVLPTLAEWAPGFAGLRYPSRYAIAVILVVTLLATWWMDKSLREKRIGSCGIKICLGLQGTILVAGLFTQSLIYRIPPGPTNEDHLMADLRTERLPRDGAPPRVALPASILRANEGAQCGVSTLTGFNNPALGRTWTSFYLMAGNPIPSFHRVEVTDDIILKLGEYKRYFGLSAVLTQPGNEVHFAPPPMPRAFLSFASSRVSDWREAVMRVRGGHDFVREALVEQDLSLPGANRQVTGRVEILAFDRNRITMEYSASSPGLLVLAEAWYPGWTARINETARIPVIPVNGWMRGIPIPAGTNRISFEYQPTHWWLGVFISVTSALGTFFLWRFSANRAPRQLAE